MVRVKSRFALRKALEERRSAQKGCVSKQENQADRVAVATRRVDPVPSQKNTLCFLQVQRREANGRSVDRAHLSAFTGTKKSQP